MTVEGHVDKNFSGTCAACFGPFEDIRVLQRGHSFCFEHIRISFQTEPQCPTCGTPIHPSIVYDPNLLPDNFAYLGLEASYRDLVTRVIKV